MADIVFLGLVYLLIILLTGLLLKQIVEHFSKKDPMLTNIDRVKRSFKGMYTTIQKKKLSDIEIKNTSMKSSVVVQKNIISLNELTKSYKLKLKIAREVADKRQVVKDVTEEIKAFINTYNDINKQLDLKLPEVSGPAKIHIIQKVVRVPKKKTAQKYGKQFKNQLGMPYSKLQRTLNKQVKGQRNTKLRTQKPKTLASKKPPKLLNVRGRTRSRGRGKSVRSRGRGKSVRSRGLRGHGVRGRPGYGRGITGKKQRKNMSIVEKIKKDFNALFLSPIFPSTKH